MKTSSIIMLAAMALSCIGSNSSGVNMHYTEPSRGLQAPPKRNYRSFKPNSSANIKRKLGSVRKRMWFLKAKKK